MIHSFGAFELDGERFELRKNHRVVAIPPKVFDLLRCLVERPDAVVSHGELMRLVWPGVAITKDSLTQVVMLARAALDEDVDRPRFIETVRGRGYRFAGPVAIRAAEPLRESPKGSAPAVRATPKPGSDPNPDRAAHSAMLRERFDRARSGRGGVVLVTGEAGIGKTHLTEAFASGLAADDHDAFLVKCYEGDGAPPLWPFAQVLRGLVSAGVELGQELKALAEGRAEAMLGSAASRFALFDRCARVLIDHARTARPVLLIIDDFQRADVHSIELLAVLSSQIRTARMLVVVVYDRASPRISIFGASMAALAHEPTTSTQRLGPLTRGEVATIVRVETGGEPDEMLVDKLLDKTKGNPLLLSQLVRVLRAREADVDVETSALVGGDDLRDAVSDMLQALPAPTLEILTVAAVFGRVFPLTSLAGALGRSNAEVMQELDSAALARVVARTADSYRFTYPLVCDVLYRRMPIAERTRLHAVVASALRERLGKADHHAVGEIARHLALAAALGDVDDAADWALRAIDLARASGDGPAMVRYAKRGLEALRFAPRPDPDRRARLSGIVDGTAEAPPR